MKNSKFYKDIIFLVIAIAFLGVIVYLLKFKPDIQEEKKNISGKKALNVEKNYENGCPTFDQEKASKLIELSLACADKEYPNKPNYVFEEDSDMTPPRVNTPSFFGCFDWHSAVHAHWSMVRVLNLLPDISKREEIMDTLKRHLNQRNIMTEMNFFKERRNNLFERPYGWGWLLRLAIELKKSNNDELHELYKNIEPFSDFLAKKFIEYLNKLSRPIREGTHQNTAFSMIHLYDYLSARNMIDEKNYIIQKATTLYYLDADCPINYEPSGEDFISPCLTEAELMRRVLPKEQFINWFDKFITVERLSDNLIPVTVYDPKDPRVGHLIGLYYQRASTLEGILSVLPQQDFRREYFEYIKDFNCKMAEKYISESGYGGEHWLATFAIYFFTNATIK